MAKRRRDVWECDAPGCSVTVEETEDDPEGYNGVVSGVGGSGVRKVPWYACSQDHVGPAVLWVAKMAHQRAWS